MSVNKDRPHILVLPEDKANEQLANGFHLEFGSIRQMQVLPVAGGWNAVLDIFNSEHVTGMDRYFHRYMILLIDFDGVQGRLDKVKARIPEHLAGRVFILGVWSEPEDLKRVIGESCEIIGRKLAEECRNETDEIWKHDLLRHNVGELDRLREHLRLILFEVV
ncbi:MAG: hypothetical protein WCD76_18515 [Pyrinomonadaceae bacterium]